MSTQNNPPKSDLYNTQYLYCVLMIANSAGKGDKGTAGPLPLFKGGKGHAQKWRI